VKRAAAAWERFWFAPEPTSTLALFRIAIGVISFAWALSLVPDLHAFFSSEGIEPLAPAHPSAGAWGLLNAFPSYTAASVLLVVLMVASVCLTVGYRTRIASVAVFVALVSFQHRAPSIWNSGDGLLRNFSFYLMLAPAGASLSVDRWRTARERFWEFPARAPWALRLVQIQISVVYLSSMWFKIHGSAWRNGTAVSFAMRMEDLERFAVPGILSHSLLFSSVMTYWTLAVELMFGILVWNRAARPWVLTLGATLHVLVGLNIRLGFFSETMLAGYLVFVSPAAATVAILWIRDRFDFSTRRTRDSQPPSLPSSDRQLRHRIVARRRRTECPATPPAHSPARPRGVDEVGQLRR
jgi:Vitamin K-dependent gamma-carboxylase